MQTLPKEINYSKKSTLPNGTSCLSAVVAPANGSSFGDSQLIQFNLPNRGYLVPESLYLRYKTTVTVVYGTTTAGTAAIKGSFPGYSPFLRLETVIGSSTVESIANYHQMCQAMLSAKVSIGQKFALAYPMGVGYVDNALSTAYTQDNLNGHKIQNGVTSYSYFSAIPVNSIFSNAENLIPLKFMPGCTINLYTDAASNISSFSPTAATGGAPSISLAYTNLELCMDLIDFNQDTDEIVSQMVDQEGKLTIKSQSYLTSTQNIGTGAVGTYEYIYSMRLASIKSLFLIPCTPSTTNNYFDSSDVTRQTNASGVGGDYTFFIASTPYPSRPISTILNRAAVLTELGYAMGTSAQSISSFNMSITSDEFTRNNASTSTVSSPSKFFLGVNTERLATNSALLTGVSSQNSPISARINIGTATTVQVSLTMIANFDAIILVDIANRQCQVLV